MLLYTRINNKVKWVQIAVIPGNMEDKDSLATNVDPHKVAEMATHLRKMAILDNTLKGCPVCRTG